MNINEADEYWWGWWILKRLMNIDILMNDEADEDVGEDIDEVDIDENIDEAVAYGWE